MLIDELKDWLGLSETNKRLERALSMAESAAKRYCNVDEITEDMEDGIIQLASMYYKNPTGISSESQGARSRSYRDGIPNDIKDMLPAPKVKAGG